MSEDDDRQEEFVPDETEQLLSNKKGNKGRPVELVQKQRRGAKDLKRRIQRKRAQKRRQGGKGRGR